MTAHQRLPVRLSIISNSYSLSHERPCSRPSCPTVLLGPWTDTCQDSQPPKPNQPEGRLGCTQQLFGSRSPSCSNMMLDEGSKRTDIGEIGQQTRSVLARSTGLGGVPRY